MEYADKSKENKSTTISNHVSQQRKSQPALQFVDNRPKAAAQLKMQELINNSGRVTQLHESFSKETIQGKFEGIQKKENKTGLPDHLKASVENLSGFSMDEVKVHYNSAKPAQLQAHAYAQGTDIHIGPGQEKHLPHEAWHVVQQKQGRVKPTVQMKGISINDHRGLEHEADLMGKRVMNSTTFQMKPMKIGTSFQNNPIQLFKTGITYKTTAGELYRTKINDSNYLGVKAGATQPSPQAYFTAGNTTSGFKEYKFSNAFQNDCLQFAQKLALAINGRAANEILRVKVGGVESNVGFAIENNSKSIADKAGFGLNGATNPAIGESYAIGPKSNAPVLDGCAFHISTVIAKDGGDNVTCEADAGNEGLTEPVFDMYETAPHSELTFHARYKGDYGAAYATTGVLTAPTGPRKLADAIFPAPVAPVAALHVPQVLHAAAAVGAKSAMDLTS